MDILDQYFGEEMQKYMPKFELGTVYSDPYTSAFRKIEEGPATKKLRIFDFDDTLAKVKANIIVKNKDKEFTLTPAEFAVYVPKTGDAFNFKEFNAIIKTAAPTTKTTILTARLLGYPVKKYLKTNFNLDVYVVGLGDANPQKKADYIEKEIKKGYNDIVFIDDSIKNVKAVSGLKEKYPMVKLEVIHTTDAEHIKL